MSPQEDPYARREVEDAQATLRKAKRDLNALLRRAGLPTVREDDRGSFFFAGESLILPVLAIYSGSMGIAKLTIALHAAPSIALVSALVLPTWALILSWKYAVPRLMGTTRPSRTDKALLRTLRNYAAAA